MEKGDEVMDTPNKTVHVGYLELVFSQDSVREALRRDDNLRRKYTDLLIDISRMDTVVSSGDFDISVSKQALDLFDEIVESLNKTHRCGIPSFAQSHASS